MSEAKLFTGAIHIAANAPIVLAPSDSSKAQLEDGDVTSARLKQVVAYGKAYRAAARKLFAESYSDHAGAIPAWLRGAARTFYLLCRDGLIVRYDQSPADEPESRAFVGIQQGKDVADLLPMLSDSFVLACRNGEAVGTPSVELHLTRSTPDGAVITLGQGVKFCLVVDLEKAARPSGPRPRPVVSVSNIFEASLVLQEADERGAGVGQRALVRSSWRLPVGWEGIEVYRPEDLAAPWDVEAAPQFAADDLSALLLKHHLELARLHSLDPNAELRAAQASLLAELQRLVDDAEREEELHHFLKLNPFILCPDHVKSWSKLAFGDRETDFVFRQPGPRYLLVEIERPDRQMFTQAGAPAAPLTHAIHQTTEWLRYLGDNVQTMRNEKGLEGIEPRVPCLVVMGRSRDLTPTNRRELATMTQGSGVKVITYDEMIESAKAVIEQLVGPIFVTSENGTVYYLPPEKT